MQIMLTETGVALLKLRIALASGDSTRHEQPHAVSHEPPHVIHTVLRQSVGPERIVATGGKVVERVEQRAVQIKDICIVLHMQPNQAFPKGKDVDYLQEPSEASQDFKKEGC